MLFLLFLFIQNYEDNLIASRSELLIRIFKPILGYGHCYGHNGGGLIVLFSLIVRAAVHKAAEQPLGKVPIGRGIGRFFQYQVFEKQPQLADLLAIGSEKPLLFQLIEDVQTITDPHQIVRTFIAAASAGLVSFP
jgi:hypothetical protein